MSASLVGSEMCIRDSFGGAQNLFRCGGTRCASGADSWQTADHWQCVASNCLLYTSDAADDM
eukprot:15067867-Alexandrium_andersonii.AAC.1